MAGGGHGGHAGDRAHRSAITPDPVLVPNGHCPSSGDDTDLRGQFASVETVQLRQPIVATCKPTRSAHPIWMQSPWPEGGQFRMREMPSVRTAALISPVTLALMTPLRSMK